MKLHYKKYLKSYSQNLRKAGNLSEVILWNELKKEKLGARFLRQRPIGEYSVDFYCHSLNLVIEIDGVASHDNKIQKDKLRDNILKSIGIKVLSYKDADIRYNLFGVLEDIKREVLKNPPAFGPAYRQAGTPFRKGGIIQVF
jgi:very-short-patch-repair endonuclease